MKIAVAFGLRLFFYTGRDSLKKLASTFVRWCCLVNIYFSTIKICALFMLLVLSY